MQRRESGLSARDENTPTPIASEIASYPRKDALD